MRLRIFTAHLLLLVGLSGTSALADPFITSLDPNVGSIGAQIIINGTGFSAGGGAVQVTFNGTVDPGAGATSDTIIYAHVPPGASSGLVFVTVLGLTSNGRQFTVIGTGPYITGFSPTYGSTNDLVVISGYNFTGVAANGVKFNGTSSKDAVANGAGTSINVHPPPGATSGPLTVTASGGTSNTVASFTVIGPGPYITGFSPSMGNVGTPVQITGELFTGATNVQFNGVSVPGFSPPASDTLISVNVPAGASSGPITVQTPSGTWTTPTNFFLPPKITSVSPMAAAPGAAVTIIGTSFAGLSSVTFNGVPAFTQTNGTATQITAYVPASATSGPIVVSAPAGAVQTNGFVVLPLITSFSPTKGPPGTVVTINGYGFSGTPTVAFNGAGSGSVTLVNSGQLTATVPSSATSGLITVTTSAGTASSANSSTPYFCVPPIISSFSPNTNSFYPTITISGTHFANPDGSQPTVLFNGTPAFGINANTDTSIAAIAPQNATTGPITVSTCGGSTNSAAYFYGSPSISLFSPGDGVPAVGGAATQVTISGQNFLGASQVLFSGLNGPISATFVVTNNNLIGTYVPLEAQTGPISVVAPAGTATSGSSFVLDYKSDLSPTPTPSATAVTVGSNLVYTILVYNNGYNGIPYKAYNVRITNTLPASVTLTSAYTTQGSLTTNGNPVLGNLGTLPAFQTASIVLGVVPHTVGFITNTISVGSDYPDPNPSDNTKTTVVRVMSPALLSIKLSGRTQATISWPSDLYDFSLQYKNSLAAAGGWLSVTNQRQTNLTSIFVIENNLTAAKYYRLIK
jgi:uncharacterized repeat protein (TIGR01451 family)